MKEGSAANNLGYALIAWATLGLSGGTSAFAVRTLDSSVENSPQASCMGATGGCSPALHLNRTRARTARGYFVQKSRAGRVPFAGTEDNKGMALSMACGFLHHGHLRDGRRPAGMAHFNS